MIKIFADCADWHSVQDMCKLPYIKGFTTNPTIAYKAGITDYKKYACDIIKYLHDERPDTCISLEVFGDNFEEMIRQAEVINSWAGKYSVYVKIPITTTQSKRSYTSEVIRTLTDNGIKVNVTAVMTSEQIDIASKSINAETPSIISVFCGRMYDCGQDPSDIMYSYDPDNRIVTNTEFLWASPRQVYDYVLAKNKKFSIITMTPELIKKLSMLGKDLEDHSLDTVKMFYEDGKKIGFNV